MKYLSLEGRGGRAFIEESVMSQELCYTSCSKMCYTIHPSIHPSISCNTPPTPTQTMNKAPQTTPTCEPRTEPIPDPPLPSSSSHRSALLPLQSCTIPQCDCKRSTPHSNYPSEAPSVPPPPLPFFNLDFPNDALNRNNKTTTTTAKYDHHFLMRDVVGVGAVVCHHLL